MQKRGPLVFVGLNQYVDLLCKALNKYGIEFTIVDNRSLFNYRYVAYPNNILRVDDNGDDCIYPTISFFDENGDSLGSFEIKNNEDIINLAQLLSSANYYFLPLELLGKDKFFIESYIFNKLGKKKRYLAIADIDSLEIWQNKIYPLEIRIHKYSVGEFTEKMYTQEDRNYHEDRMIIYQDYDLYLPPLPEPGDMLLFDENGKYENFGNIWDTIIPFKSKLRNLNCQIKPYKELENGGVKIIAPFKRYFVFIHIETTEAIIDNEASPEEFYLWPRIIGLSYVVSDRDGNIKNEFYETVDIDNIGDVDWSQTHGITLEELKYNSSKIEKVLEHFYNNLLEISYEFTLVGYNIDLILNAIIAECYRYIYDVVSTYEDANYENYLQLYDHINDGLDPWFIDNNQFLPEDLISILRSKKKFCIFKNDSMPYYYDDNLDKVEINTLQSRYYHFFNKEILCSHFSNFAVATYDCFLQLTDLFYLIEKDNIEQKQNICFMFFDTETTGLPKNYDVPSSDVDNWPRMVQFSWILTDFNGNIITEEDNIIKPQGFTIPTYASRIHNITNEKAMEKGAELELCLKNFISCYQNFEKYSNCKIIFVGHNIEFDLKIIEAELYRLQRKRDITKIRNKETICTMKSTINYCAIEDWDTDGYKYPSLQELHYKLLQRRFEDAHNSAADVLATKDCFFRLLHLKRIIVSDDGTIQINDSEERRFSSKDYDSFYD